MKQASCLGTVKDGKLELRNPQIFKEELKGLFGDVTLTVAEGRGKRSNQQNKYYWSVVCGTISDHTGYTPKEVHEYYKDMFLSEKKHITIGEDEREVETATTTRLTTKQFEEYCENIRRHASEKLHLDIPEPNEETHEPDELDEFVKNQLAPE